MTGFLYQLKNIRRDKLCILTFLLPILAGIGIHFLSDLNFSAVAEISFGVIEKQLSPDTLQWLERSGTVTPYADEKELEKAVNDPSTQLIGVVAGAEQGIRTLRAGDELAMTESLADRLPLLFAQRDLGAAWKKTVLPAQQNNDLLQSLLIVITLVTAMFMGCTFNAMSMISEKEEGILMINEILPMKKSQYMIQKMALGFAGGTLSTALTALICMRINGTVVVPLTLLIILSSFLAALTGLFIGRLSGGLMTGIVYIKVVMLVFLALPIVFYLYVPEPGLAHNLTYLLPSAAAFYGLMELLNGQSRNMDIHLLILLGHCLIWFLAYLLLSLKLRKHG